MHRNLCNNVYMGAVLIAEDDQGIRAMAGSLLRKEGHRVDFAANGVEAIECIQSKQYDCILLDLMMPTASGYEVLAWMHRERKGLAAHRVIVVTALGGPALAHLTPERVFAVVRKPFDVNELRSLVAKCTAGDGN